MRINRSERMENRTGLAGLVDRLRYHEASRQGFGFLLVLVCTLFAASGESRIIAGFVLVVIGQGWRIYSDRQGTAGNFRYIQSLGLRLYL